MAFDPTAEGATPFDPAMEGATPIDPQSELSFTQKAAQKVGSAAPYVGGILGSLIGAGATLPTVAGVPLGAAAGAAAGTGAGLALGESVKNLAGVQDKTQKQLAIESVARPALAGATDFVAGQTIQHVLKPVGIALKGGAEGIYRSFIPKNASSKMFSSIFKTNYKLTEKLNTPEVSKEMVKHGIHGDLDDMIRISKSVTGADGIISKATRNAVGSITDDVPVSGAITAARRAGEQGTNIDKVVGNRIVTNISDIVGSGKDIGTMNPLDALDAERTLEKIGYDMLDKAAGKGGMDQLILEQQAEMYLSAADEIGKQINSKVVSSGVLDSMKQSPQMLTALESISPRLKQQFLNAKTLGELRSIAKPFVRLGILAEKTQAAQGSQFVTTVSGKGLLNTLLGGLQRPEAASSFAQATQAVGDSAIGKGAAIASKGTQTLAEIMKPTLNPATRGLLQILTQAGLTESLEQEQPGSPEL
jgi:hypothetical protein